MTTIFFNSIEFNSATKELSFHPTDASLPITKYKLHKKAVKVQISGDQADIETGVIGAFPTEGFELKLDFIGSNKNSDLFFGNMGTVCTIPFQSKNYEVGVLNKFHLLWIGSDDIRNNLNGEPEPLGFLLMEDQEVSFEIQENDKYLVIRYHT